MSVPAVATPGAVVPAGAPIPGLEDYDPNVDQVTPRLTIDQKKGVFVNSLSKEEFPALDAILLGLVKQRSMWPAVFDGSDDPPLCKSNDFANGNPGKNFPWDKSGFDPKDYAEEGSQLPCASCPLREWGSHPTADTPWCSEQHTYIIMLPGGDEHEVVWMPALFSVQRTGIKPSRTYINSFQQARTPMFIVKTHLSLSHHKRGMNDYYVCEFARGEGTDQTEWANFTNSYRVIRDVITTSRLLEEPTSTPVAAPAAAASPTSSPPASAAAAGAAVPADDEIPF